MIVNETYRGLGYGTETVKASAFRDASYLTEIVIPRSLIRINTYAFSAMGNLKVV